MVCVVLIKADVQDTNLKIFVLNQEKDKTEDKTGWV